MTLLSKFKNILVTCHDSGGAEVVSSWVRRNRNVTYAFLLDGPSIEIFQRKLGAIEILHPNSLTGSFIRKFDLVLTGTGATGLENKAVKIGKDFGVPTVSFIDHWSNYFGRFRYGDALIFPDEIWVGDERAYQIAHSCFEKQVIRLVPNPYFMDAEEEFAKCSVVPRNSQEFRILYVCEAIGDLGKKFPSGKPLEYRCMDIFFNHLKCMMTDGAMVTVKLRLHPSEDASKYALYLNDAGPLRVELSEGTTLIEDCVWTDWVVGMNSMALVIAKMGAKRVFYCNLNGAKPKNIPTAGLENFVNTTHLDIKGKRWIR